MDLGLRGKSAIVTGAGRGIGRAVVLTLAREGANVAVNDLQADVAKSVAEEAKALGVQALAFPGDMTDLAAATALGQTALKTFGQVDILVNTVGVPPPGGGEVGGAFPDLTPSEWLPRLNLTLVSAFNCTKAVLDHMIERRQGRIVNLSSTASLVPTPGMIMYATAKGGINAFTMTLAAELGRYGITVNAIAPGLVRTSRTLEAEAKKGADPKSKRRLEMEEVLVRYTPTGHAGQPQDIASAVAFLASDAASQITGQVLRIDGGYPALTL